MEVILIRMNATPAARDTCLVGSVIIGIPLEVHIRARTVIDLHAVGRGLVMMETARERRTARQVCQHFRRRTAEGRMARHIARKGWGIERLALEGHPIRSEHPAYGGLMRGNRWRRSVLVVFTRPGIHRHLAHVERTRIVTLGVHVPDELVLASRGRRSVRNEFRDSRNQRQALWIVGRQVAVRGLTFASHVADGSDGAHAGVVALQRPSSTSSVMHATGQSEVRLDIPLQIVDHRTSATDALHQGWVIGHFIGQDVPMARRRFGIGSIRPELGEHANVVRAFNRVGGIRIEGDWILRVTRARVCTQRVVADHTRRDIHDGLIIQPRTLLQYIHEVGLV